MRGGAEGDAPRGIERVAASSSGEASVHSCYASNNVPLAEYRREAFLNVTIKDFGVEMAVKNRGIEFEIRDPSGNFIGDCYLTKSGLIWCRGKTTKKNGVWVTWDEFIKWMES